MRYLSGGEFNMLGINWASPWLFFIGLAIILYTMFGWWSDTIKEGDEGHHTRVVSLHLRYGMILFIASEVMFFVAWFWAYFDVALFPGDAHQYMRTELTGAHWPPAPTPDSNAFKGTFDPWHLPLLNTLILLTSGTTVTWAHHALLEGDRKAVKQALWLTVLLGGAFTCVQAYEYAHAAFTFSGGQSYLLWKIERHSGVRVEPLAWERRHPLLSAPFLAWRVYRKGGFR